MYNEWAELYDLWGLFESEYSDSNLENIITASQVWNVNKFFKNALL